MKIYFSVEPQNHSELQYECLLLERERIKEHRELINLEKQKIAEERHLIRLQTHHFAKLSGLESFVEAEPVENWTPQFVNL